MTITFIAKKEKARTQVVEGRRKRGTERGVTNSSNRKKRIVGKSTWADK